MTGPVVVKIGGAALDAPGACAGVWEAIASASGAVVVVHGGGAAVDRALRRLGMEVRRVEGIRVTPEEQIGEIVGVLAGRVNTEIVGLLSRLGARAVGLTLGDGGMCRARVATRYAFDAGRVGEIEGGDGGLIRSLLSEGFVPVVSSIAIGEDGRALNVNADEAAAALARIVGARALVLLTDVEGILDERGEVIGTMTPGEVERSIERGTIRGGMIPKARGAVEAAISSGIPAVVAGWKTGDVLGRISRGERPGTWVAPAGETAIRASR